ncbi:hypothetical protein HMPREF0670_00802 [Prevotella sp. oral taxon 317 str. F0108]|nr:hypothetical protein HMPREF0670_00802 [Prevotella sp. oral taxon 317 str. F0108]
MFIQSAKVRKKVIIAKYRYEKGYMPNGMQLLNAQCKRECADKSTS